MASAYRRKSIGDRVPPWNMPIVSWGISEGVGCA